MLEEARLVRTPITCWDRRSGGDRMTVHEKITRPIATTDAQDVASPPSKDDARFHPHSHSGRAFSEADDPGEDDADNPWTEC